MLITIVFATLPGCSQIYLSKQTLVGQLCFFPFIYVSSTRNISIFYFPPHLPNCVQTTFSKTLFKNNLLSYIISHSHHQ